MATHGHLSSQQVCPVFTRLAIVSYTHISCACITRAYSMRTACALHAPWCASCAMVRHPHAPPHVPSHVLWSHRPLPRSPPVLAYRVRLVHAVALCAPCYAPLHVRLICAIRERISTTYSSLFLGTCCSIPSSERWMSTSPRPTARLPRIP